MTEEFAPAKVNLALHLTGLRADGYHLLDSFVMFASVGDTLRFSPAQSLSLSVDGPEAGTVPTDKNSVLSAAQLLSPNQGAHIHLTKRLPVAAGIGGGTADAAAAYRGLSRVWGIAPFEPTPQTFAHVAQLGADVPVCLASRTARMSGIGEKIELLPDVPSLDAVLVNPRVEVSTPKVFKTIAQKNNAPMTSPPASFASSRDVISWLSQQRNDMQPAAQTIEPVITDVLSQIAATNRCDLARMSGSGATCFGLYSDTEAAQHAATVIAKRHPNWWVHACTLGDAR